MLESAWPLLQSTCLAGSSSLATTQHKQSGPQHSGWLEAAWPFASLNLPGPYWQSEQRRCDCRAAAAVEPAKQVQLELALEVQVQDYSQVDPNHFESRRAVTNCEVEKSRGFKFKTLPLHLHWQQTRCRGTVTCPLYDLGLADMEL